MVEGIRDSSHPIHCLEIVEYLESLHEAAKRGAVIFDFSEVIKNCHKMLGESIWRIEADGVKNQREHIYQDWLGYQMASLSRRALMGVQLSSEINRVLVNLNSNLSASGSTYRTSRDGHEVFSNLNEKDRSFRLFSSYIEAYVEIQLCNIHIAASDDVDSIKNDMVFGRMNEVVLSELLECVKSELNFWQNRFQRRSPIYHCVMEKEGVDVSTLLRFIGVDLTVDDIWQEVWREREITSEGDLRVLRCSWQYAAPNQVDRLKALVRLLRKVEALDIILLNIKSETFKVGAPVVNGLDSDGGSPGNSKPWGK